jgi:hypothetical protein
MKTKIDNNKKPLREMLSLLLLAVAVRTMGANECTDQADLSGTGLKGTLCGTNGLTHSSYFTSFSESGGYKYLNCGVMSQHAGWYFYQHLPFLILFFPC